MSKNHRMTFHFSQDQETDHPDSQYGTDYTSGNADRPSPKRPRHAAVLDWDDPNKILQKPRYYEGSQQRYQEDFYVEDSGRWSNEGPSLPLTASRKKRKKRPGIAERKTSNGGRRSFLLDGFLEWFKENGRALLTGGGAIVVGLMMGLIVLSVFSNLSTDETGQIANSNSNGQANVNLGVENNDSSIEGETEAPSLVPSGTVENGELNLPSRSYMALQAGAFSDQESGETMLEQIQDAGLSGLLIREGEHYHLYVSMSTAQEDMYEVSQYLEESGLDTYVREQEVPAVEEVDTEQDLTHLPEFTALGDQLIGQLGKLSGEHLTGETEGLSGEKWEDIQHIHHEFLEAGNAVFNEGEEDIYEAGNGMIKSMTSAIHVLEDYLEQPNESYIWQIQQAILQYVHHYKQLTSELNT